MVPSDSDYRIFRDFGHIPGIDFAHPFNGYRYHTKYDSIHYLTMSVLQRTGDNLLGLTKGIIESNRPDVRNYERNTYFDILGYCLISYTEKNGIWINLIVSLTSILFSYYFLCKSIAGKSHN